MTVPIDKELRRVEDTAAGQREYVRQNLSKNDAPDDQEKLQIIALCVESFIDESEDEKKKLLRVIDVEKAKNRDIKDIAERLALELERLSPGHQLASDTLALLLENKMKADPAPRRKK